MLREEQHQAVAAKAQLDRDQAQMELERVKLEQKNELEKAKLDQEKELKLAELKIVEKRAERASSSSDTDGESVHSVRSSCNRSRKSGPKLPPFEEHKDEVK